MSNTHLALLNAKNEIFSFFQVPKVSLIQGKPGTTVSTAGKGIPQGATIVKLVSAQGAQGNITVMKHCDIKSALNISTLQYS